MTSLSVVWVDRVDGNKIERFPIDIGHLNEQSDSLFSRIALETGSKESDFEIIYCGQKLERSTVLQTYNLTPQSTLYVFRKAPEPSPPKAMPDIQRAGEMMPMIYRACQHPGYKKIVEQLLTSQEALQKMMTAVPGLDRDPVVLSMLQDQELLSILAHRQNIYKVMQKHPLFGPAAMYVASVVNKEQQEAGRSARSNVYSLDQMSDEEEDDPQRGARQQPITASQLAQALATATASSASPSASTSAVPGSSASNSATSLISHDFFQQAMMTAQSTAVEAQVQQLRDMGISDDNLARQALAATGGDLHAALEFIFGDNAM